MPDAPYHTDDPDGAALLALARIVFPEGPYQVAFFAYDRMPEPVRRGRHGLALAVTLPPGAKENPTGNPVSVTTPIRSREAGEDRGAWAADHVEALCETAAQVAADLACSEQALPPPTPEGLRLWIDYLHTQAERVLSDWGRVETYYDPLDQAGGPFFDLSDDTDDPGPFVILLRRAPAPARMPGDMEAHYFRAPSHETWHGPHVWADYAVWTMNDELRDLDCSMAETLDAARALVGG